MQISSKGLDLIKFWEQLRLKAYLDGGGVPTIGWGTTLYPDGTKVKMIDICTQDQAQTYLENDVSHTEEKLSSLIKAQINQPMFDALCVFAYNIGTGAFASSTLLKLLNKGQFTLASQQFSRWNKDNGAVVAGLVKRRASEQKMFDGGVASLSVAPVVSDMPSDPPESPLEEVVETIKSSFSSSKKKK